MMGTEDHTVKLMTVVFLLVLGALPLISRFDVFPTATVVPFGLLAGALFITAIVGGYWGRQITGIAMVGCLSVTILATYQAPLFEGSLFVYDQHIGAHVISETMNSGYFPEPPDRFIRGFGVTNIYPLLYAFGAVVGKITGLSGFVVTKVLPMLVLGGVPVVGATIAHRSRYWLALLWLAPVFFSNSAATTVAQLFAVPLFALVLVSLRDIGSWRFRSIFLLAAVAITITHSATPVILAFVVFGYFLGLYVSGKRNEWPVVLSYGVILFGLWVIMNHTVFFGVLSRSMIGVITKLPLPSGGGSGGGSTSSALELAYVSKDIPRSWAFWAGLFFRFLSFTGLGFVFLALRDGFEDFWNEIFDPDITALLVAGPPAFAISVVIGLVNFDRSWLLATLAATTAFIYVLADLDRESTSRMSLSTAVVLVATAFAIVPLAGYYHFSTSGPLSSSLAVSTGATTVLLLVAAAIVYRTSPSLGSRLGLSSHPLGVVAKGLILALLLGHLLVGVSPETFSSEAREEAFQSPGLTKYHKPWDYSTSAFASEYTDPPLVGDSRIFIAEEFYRHDIRDIPQCYRTRCNQDVIVWYDVYGTVWQGVDLYGPIFTSFPDADRQLQRDRSKVYSTGHSSIFASV